MAELYGMDDGLALHRERDSEDESNSGSERSSVSGDPPDHESGEDLVNSSDDDDDNMLYRRACDESDIDMDIEEIEEAIVDTSDDDSNDRPIDGWTHHVHDHLSDPFVEPTGPQHNLGPDALPLSTLVSTSVLTFLKNWSSKLIDMHKEPRLKQRPKVFLIGEPGFPLLFRRS